MEFREVVAGLRARWWLPVVGLILGGALALATSLLARPQYTAVTQLFVSTTQSASTSEVYQGSQFSQQRVSSYAELLMGEELADRVVDRLQLSTTARELAPQISATPVPNTVLIDVSVTDPSPGMAQEIARAVGAEFTSMVAELETPDGAATSPVKVTVVDRPETPDAPSEPQTLRNVALGLLVGLLLGAFAAVARMRLDRTVREPDEAGTVAGSPVIGTILRDDALAKGRCLERTLMGRTAEDYRQLRTNLQFLSVDQPPKVIMISSALPSEGKTTMTINIALALADAGRKVVVVEADLRRPRVTRYLQLVGGVGLTNVLAGTAELDEVLQPYGPSGMAVLAAGPTPPNPGELLSSSHMASLLEKLRVDNDYVIIDSPPLLPVADASGLAPLADGVILSVRYGTTRKDQLRQAATSVERVGARLLGVVLNIVPPKAQMAAAYGYGYGYDAPPKRAAAIDS